MKSYTPTPAEMAARTARFDELAPYSQHQEAADGIPAAAVERVAARRVYPVMVPENYSGRSQHAPVKAGERVVISIAECPPGNGPGLHIHETTTESFFCLEGRFRVSWGEEGQHETILEPHDFVSVPPGVLRDFQNISDVVGRLFVVIETAADSSTDNVAFAPSVGAAIAADFGADVVGRLEANGYRFNAGA